MNRDIFTKAAVFAILALCLVFAGCSDSTSPEDNGGTPPPAGAVSGVFLDAPVEGLYFDSGSYSGYTDAGGTFFYKSGDIVRFYVGDILLGQAVGKSMVTPFDLAGMEEPPQTSGEIMKERNRMVNSSFASPLEVVMNIATLLQTLDEDGDDSNGIVIPDGIHDLTEGLVISFAQYPEDFIADYQVNELMKRGREDGLWGGVRAVVNGYYALDSLYEGLGIEPEIYAAAAYYFSTDGEPESWDEKDTAQYDKFGNRSQILHDVGLDGPDSFIKTEFDDNGYLTSLTETSLIVQYHVEYNTFYWTYYDSTSLVRRNFYDDNGYITEAQLEEISEDYRIWEVISTFRRDNSPPVSVNDVTYYTSDSHGNPTIAANYVIGLDEFNRRTETLIETRTTEYEYNSIGVPVSQVRIIDDGGDGTLDFMEIITRDDDGNVTLRADYDLTANPDPVVDTDYETIDMYAYENGRLISHQFEGPDADTDPDFEETYAYDTNGLLVLHAYDGPETTPYPAFPQYVNDPDYTEEYTYDSNGFMLTFTYAGGITWSRAFVPGSGWVYTSTPDPNNRNEEYTYNDSFAMTSLYSSAGDVTKTYVYDDRGLFLSESDDYDSDGTVENISEATYREANGFKSLQYLW